VKIIIEEKAMDYIKKLGGKITINCMKIGKG
jgi:hypothetical protein